MDRRQFLGSAVASPLIPGIWAECAPDGDSPKPGLYVPAGEDRFKAHLKIWGLTPLDGKVSGKDTNGGLYISEHTNIGKGGPFRHLHHDQDEWFYAIRGEFVFEVGDQTYRLNPGDSLFAPRKVPHAWAHVDNEPGTLLLAVFPAGTMEDFYRESANLKVRPSREALEKLFAAHGMKLLGEPLKVD
jgi:mannose-6-phosphate isomerase-like protein (cupin superfamily)